MRPSQATYDETSDFVPILRIFPPHHGSGQGAFPQETQGGKMGPSQKDENEDSKHVKIGIGDPSGASGPCGWIRLVKSVSQCPTRAHNLNSGSKIGRKGSKNTKIGRKSGVHHPHIFPPCEEPLARPLVGCNLTYSIGDAPTQEADADADATRAAG